MSKQTIAPRNLPSNCNNQTSVPALLLEPYRQTEQACKALEAWASERDYGPPANRRAEALERQALVEVERSRAAFAIMMGPASDEEIAFHLNKTFACWPAKDDEYLRMQQLLEDVGEERPSRHMLIYACAHLRKTHKFRPAISEVIDALKVARQHTLRLQGLLPKVPEQQRAQDEADARQRMRQCIEDDFEDYWPPTGPFAEDDLDRLGLLDDEVAFEELEELTQDVVLQRLNDAEAKNDE
jgi:hypothetical protein